MAASVEGVVTLCPPLRADGEPLRCLIALTNYMFIAHDSIDTDEALKRLEQAR